MTTRRRGRSNAPKRPWKIVVGADDPIIAELYARVLMHSGHEVTITTSQEATLLNAVRDKPDVIILDLTEAGAGGNLRVLQQIRNHTDDEVFALRVILVGGQKANQLFAWESGIDGFLGRPFPVEDLLRQIEAVMERRDDERPRHRRIERDKALGLS